MAGIDAPEVWLLSFSIQHATAHFYILRLGCTLRKTCSAVRCGSLSVAEISSRRKIRVLPTYLTRSILSRSMYFIGYLPFRHHINCTSYLGCDTEAPRPLSPFPNTEIRTMSVSWDAESRMGCYIRAKRCRIWQMGERVFPCIGRAGKVCFLVCMFMLPCSSLICCRVTEGQRGGDNGHPMFQLNHLRSTNVDINN